MIDGADVIDRPLCLRCTQGSGGTGRLPRIGWVCARHRRWLGTPQHDIGALPELIDAERRYRRVLAPRGVLVGSPVMLWARECATTILGWSTTRERSRRASTSDLDLFAYPETVNVARLATSPGFNTRMLQPGLWHQDRHSLSIKAVAGLFPAAHHDDSRRAAPHHGPLRHHRLEHREEPVARARRHGAPRGQAWSIWG